MVAHIAEVSGADSSVYSFFGTVTKTNNPYNENGLVRLIEVGNSIRLEWVKLVTNSRCTQAFCVNRILIRLLLEY